MNEARERLLRREAARKAEQRRLAQEYWASPIVRAEAFLSKAALEIREQEQQRKVTRCRIS